MTQGASYAPEVKHYDTTVALTSVPALANWSAPIIVDFGSLAQGLDFNKRIGRKIRLLKFEHRVRLSILDPGQIPVTGLQVHVELWCDKLCTGTAPQIEDIKTPDTPGGSTAGFVNFANAANIRRFSKKAAFVFNVDVQQPDTGTAIKVINLKETVWDLVQYPNLNITYSSNAAGGIADIVGNQYYWILASDRGSVSTPSCQITVHSRACFVDT